MIKCFGINFKKGNQMSDTRKQLQKGFGGENLIGRRKSKRPLSTKESIHLILRTDSSFSVYLFSPLYRKTMSVLKKTAHENNVKIYELAFNFTHVHLVIKLKLESDYHKFIRVLTYRLSFLGRTIARQKQGLKNTKRIIVFKFRPFTRIVNWGKAFKCLLNYIAKNQVESEVMNQLEIFNQLETS
jgi:REP element-mobilizing transposase RayT